MFAGDPSLSADGPLAVAVPGEVAGYWEARWSLDRMMKTVHKL